MDLSSCGRAAASIAAPIATGAVAAAAGDPNESTGGRFATLDEILAGIEAVSVDSVRQVALDLFKPETVALTVLGPLQGMRIRREDLGC